MESKFPGGFPDTGRYSFSHEVLGCFLGLWTLVLTVWLYWYSARYGGLPEWDGFERVSSAARIWYDIRHLDFAHFWLHTNSLAVWPFLHSWITGILFVLFRPSFATAALVSLFAFWGTACLTVWLLLRERRPFAPAGAAAAWGLFTTSPIVLQNSVTIMTELSGLFLVLAIITCLPREKDERPGWFIPSGILLALLFMFKYNFAGLTWAALLVHRSARARFSLRKAASCGNLILFGIPIFGLALWFIPDTAHKWKNFWDFAFNNPQVYTPFGLASLLYYPQHIPEVYFALPFLFTAGVTLMLIEFPVSVKLRLTNPVFACFLVHFLAAEIHPMKMDRFQFIAVGLFFVLSGQVLDEVLTRIFTSMRIKSTAAAWTGCLLILLPAVDYGADRCHEPQIRQENSFITPLEAILDRVDPSGRTALFLAYDSIPPPSIFYYYITRFDQLEYDVRTGEHRWNLVFLFRSRESVTSLSPEERIKELRRVLEGRKVTQIAIVDCLEPLSGPAYEQAYGGVAEMAKLVPQLEECELNYEEEFHWTHTRVRIFTLRELSINCLKEKTKDEP
ncbi:MAG: ArnT family glycosyltransferase [bacterium]